MSSDFLFAQPSFLTGIARLLDLGGIFDVCNERLTGEEADAAASYADWRMTGEDLTRAIAEYRNQSSAQQLALDLSPAGVEAP
jgi:hypothetical protein